MNSRPGYAKRKPRPGRGRASNRRVVYLDDDDLRSLTLTAKRLGLSTSHTIQQAIHAFCIEVHARKVDH